jgi:hypothetical protein
MEAARAGWDQTWSVQGATYFDRLWLRYTLIIVKRIFHALLMISLAVGLARADETSFNKVKLPNLKGKQIKAVLIFSDNDKAVEVRPAKGAAVTVPYNQIDKCTYEYTEEATMVLSASKIHWLRIDYHEQNAAKILVLRLNKRNYIRILDALKAHTGIDAELFGNADKRHGGSGAGRIRSMPRIFV